MSDEEYDLFQWELDLDIDFIAEIRDSILSDVIPEVIRPYCAGLPRRGKRWIDIG